MTNHETSSPALFDQDMVPQDFAPFDQDTGLGGMQVPNAKILDFTTAKNARDERWRKAALTAVNEANPEDSDVDGDSDIAEPNQHGHWGDKFTSKEKVLICGAIGLTVVTVVLSGTIPRLLETTGIRPISTPTPVVQTIDQP